MAITANYGPVGRNPDYGQGEHNFVKMKGDGTEVIAARGSGSVHAVVIGVAGTLLKLFDTVSGGTVDDTTEIATINLSAPATEGGVIVDATFNQGLTAIVTGAASELTITGKWGRTTRTIHREFPRSNVN